jgi:hypothetical protein
MLNRKASAAGHVTSDGKLRPRRISEHTGINVAVVSRVIRYVNRPDLGTVVAFKRSYGGQLDDWVTVADDVAEAA